MSRLFPAVAAQRGYVAGANGSPPPAPSQLGAAEEAKHQAFMGTHFPAEHRALAEHQAEHAAFMASHFPAVAKGPYKSPRARITRLS